MANYCAAVNDATRFDMGLAAFSIALGKTLIHIALQHTARPSILCSTERMPLPRTALMFPMFAQRSLNTASGDLLGGISLE